MSSEVNMEERAKKVKRALHSLYDSDDSDDVAMAHMVVMFENVAFNLNQISDTLSTLNNNMALMGKLMEKSTKSNIIT